MLRRTQSDYSQNCFQVRCRLDFGGEGVEGDVTHSRRRNSKPESSFPSKQYKLTSDMSCDEFTEVQSLVLSTCFTVASIGMALVAIGMLSFFVTSNPKIISLLINFSSD